MRDIKFYNVQFLSKELKLNYKLRHEILTGEEQKGLSLSSSDQHFVIVLFPRNTMSLNSTLGLPLRNPNLETADTRYVLNKVDLVFSFITLVVGIAGNSLVIWVAGFKLKVGNIGTLPLTSRRWTTKHEMIPISKLCFKARTMSFFSFKLECFWESSFPVLFHYVAVIQCQFKSSQYLLISWDH